MILFNRIKFFAVLCARVVNLFILTNVILVSGVVHAESASNLCFGNGCAAETRHQFGVCFYPGGTANASYFVTDATPTNPADAINKWCAAFANVEGFTSATCRSYENFVSLINSGGIIAALPVLMNFCTQGVCYTNDYRVGPTCGCPDGNNHAGVGTDGACYCRPGESWYGKEGKCVPTIDKEVPPATCSKKPGFGNPIFPLSGKKLEEVKLDNIPLTMTYDSSRRTPTGTTTVLPARSPNFDLADFGQLWHSSFHKRLRMGKSALNILASRGNGDIVSFTGDGRGGFTPGANSNDRIVQDGSSTAYWYFDAAAAAQEVYSFTFLSGNSAAIGQLQSISYADGRSFSFSYSAGADSFAPAAGYLTSVVDQMGRKIIFNYQLAAGADAFTQGVINKITDAAGQVTTFMYDDFANLAKIIWPDQKVRQFVYENKALPWALTGIVDENAARSHTFKWDAEGRAIFTGKAGNVDTYSTTYATPGRVQMSENFDANTGILYRTFSEVPPVGTVVTMPNGATTQLSAIAVNNSAYSAGGSQPAGAGCAASNYSITYDAIGNVTSSDDFNGHRTCYAYDAARNLQTLLVEGLSGGSSGTTCGQVLPPSASLPTGGRKTSTKWHPDWFLEIQKAEPKRMLTNVYNEQPDPTNGGAIASCVGGTTKLPDGKLLARICKRIEQATSDINGSAGFNAVSVGNARSWSYTYNAIGQMLTMTGPRTDVVDKTTLTYDSTGNVATLTNSAGQVTSFTSYDANGRLLSMTDMNGVVTTATYSSRGWLQSNTVKSADSTNSESTTYAYDGAGEMTAAKLRDGNVIRYTYDDAHRLTGVADSGGNKIVYTLDNMGNHTRETVTDPKGVLARSTARVYDALNRLHQVTGGGQ